MNYHVWKRWVDSPVRHMMMQRLEDEKLIRRPPEIEYPAGGIFQFSHIPSTHRTFLFVSSPLCFSRPSDDDKQFVRTLLLECLDENETNFPVCLNTINPPKSVLSLFHRFVRF